MSECQSVEETYYQRTRDKILNRAKNDKKRLRYQARDKYRNLSEEEKNKKREYGRKRYRNMSKEQKEKLKEYQRIALRLKNLNLIINKINFSLRFDSLCHMFWSHNIKSIIFMSFRRTERDKNLIMHY